LPEPKAPHRLITLPKHSDARGSLVFGQEADHVPFPIKRFFLLYDVSGPRGGHAHREQHQFLTMAMGSVTILIDDGRTQTSVRLDRPELALHVPPGYWLELSDFSPGASCLVLASGPYSEADYIRDRNAFARFVQDGA
jgi:dTDP-4-dehydrorhamnose 3,5-epimerase-like enzyme